MIQYFKLLEKNSYENIYFFLHNLLNYKEISFTYGTDTDKKRHAD